MRTVKALRTWAPGVAITAAAIALAPAAGAMIPGNYEVHTPRDPGHSWLWMVRPCVPVIPDCLHVQGTPRPNGQAVPYNADAHLANGRYTMAIDQSDGVRCTVYFLPSHDTYSWDAVTLEGSVESTFDAGCGGAPGGTATYPFSLVRF